MPQISPRASAAGKTGREEDFTTWYLLSAPIDKCTLALNCSMEPTPDILVQALINLRHCFCREPLPELPVHSSMAFE